MFCENIFQPPHHISEPLYATISSPSVDLTVRAHNTQNREYIVDISKNKF